MAEWWDALRCPVCEEPLLRKGETLACGSGHSFDLARQGYVNCLSPEGHRGTADTAGMVAERAAFLEAGHFDGLIAAVAAIAAEAARGVDGCVVDAGAGTGEYLAAVLDRLPGRCGVALDISKHACRRSARAHDRAGAVVCDTWDRLPIADGLAAAVLDVFAPRNGAEFARVLAPDGALVVVTPAREHLASLVDAIGLVRVDPRKGERVDEQLTPYFERERCVSFEQPLSLSRAAARAVALMGPSAWHLGSEELDDRLQSMTEPIATLVSVTVGVWRKRVTR